MIKQRKKLKDYFDLAKKLNIIPNFFLSYPYLELQGAECFSKWGWVYIECDGVVLFPPLTSRKHTLRFPFDEIWSDFRYYSINSKNFEASFLDWEYIYDPRNFTNLSGNQWKVFRKNCRKWPKNNPDWKYNHIRVEGEVERLLGEWLEKKGDHTEDTEFLVDYITDFNNDKILKTYLYNRYGDLMGVNAMDVNYKFINYRFCIVRPGIPYLDEFMRLLFYTNPEIIKSRMLVNDGGSLGSPGLELFKDKLNPVGKRKVQSFKRKNKS